MEGVELGIFSKIPKKKIKKNNKKTDIPNNEYNAIFKQIH